MSREGRKLKGTIYKVAKTYSKEQKLYEALNLNPKYLTTTKEKLILLENKVLPGSV